MTYNGSTTDLEKLIDSASRAGTDSELIEIGRRLGAGALHIVLEVLGGPLGMQTYVPSTQNFIAAIRRTLRDQAICAGYDGTPESISMFAIEFGISKARVRQILAAQPGRERDQ
jgi:hypothetical protein